MEPRAATAWRTVPTGGDEERQGRKHTVMLPGRCFAGERAGNVPPTTTGVAAPLRWPPPAAPSPDGYATYCIGEGDLERTTTTLVGDTCLWNGCDGWPAPGVALAVPGYDLQPGGALVMGANWFKVLALLDFATPVAASQLATALR